MNSIPLEPDQRRHAAFHEAAHAVIGYYFGWWLNEEGVEIDERQYTGLRCEQRTWTERASVCVSLAGWGAEMRLAPDLARPFPDEELLACLEDLRWWGHSDLQGDEADVFERLMETRPDASDEDLMALYRGYEAETAALLARPAVWASVQRVADALLERGRLTDAEVVEMLGAEVEDGVFAEQPASAATL